MSSSSNISSSIPSPSTTTTKREEEGTLSVDHHSSHKLCGMLKKQSMGSGRWRRRFFVLSETELAYYKSAETTKFPRFRMDLKDLKAVTKRRDRPNNERFFEIHLMERQMPIQVCADTVEEALRWRRALSESANPDAKFLPLHAGPIRWQRNSLFHNNMNSSEQKVPTFESDIVEKVVSMTTTTTFPGPLKKKDTPSPKQQQQIREEVFDHSPSSFCFFNHQDVNKKLTLLDEKTCGRLRRKLQIRWMNSKLPSMGSWVQSPEDLPSALSDGFLLFQLLQELSPVEAESSRYLMLEKANTVKTRIANIEVSLRILHASRRIRCTNLPDAHVIENGRPKQRIHLFLREICAVYEIRKINVTKCLNWWNNILERHPYTKPILPTDQADWRYAMRGTNAVSSIVQRTWQSLRDGTLLAAVLHWYAGDDGDKKENLPAVSSSRLVALRHELNFSTGERAEHDDLHYVRRVDEIFSLYEEAGAVVLWDAEDWVHAKACRCPDFIILQLDLIRRRLEVCKAPRTAVQWGRSPHKPPKRSIMDEKEDEEEEENEEDDEEKEDESLKSIDFVENATSWLSMKLIQIVWNQGISANLKFESSNIDKDKNVFVVMDDETKKELNRFLVFDIEDSRIDNSGEKILLKVRGDELSIGIQDEEDLEVLYGCIEVLRHCHRKVD